MALDFLKRASTRKRSKSPQPPPSPSQQESETVPAQQHPSPAAEQQQQQRPDSPVSPLTPAQDADDLTSPILDESDELFLRRIASEAEGDPPPLPPRRTIITDDGRVLDESRAPSPLPLSESTSSAAAVPASVVERDGEPGGDASKEEQQSPLSDKERKKEAQRRMWNEWLFVPAAQGKEMVLNRMSSLRGKSKEARDAEQDGTAPTTTEGDLKESEEKAKGKGKEKADTENPTANAEEEEATKEKRDLNSLLSSLNLNNRMLSFSDDSRKLLDEFVLVLKDIVNGVPTAYDDLERLLKTRHKQISKLYGSLPPFLQTLVKSLPLKMWAALAPEVAAAAKADLEKDRKRRGSDGSRTSGGEGDSKKKSSAGKVKYAIPTLRTLVGQRGAVAAMLRSIVSFLQMRFPAVFAGTNVVLGLASFVLLFVFWYCWKRGRETRLERERGEKGDLEGEFSEDIDDEDEVEVDDSSRRYYRYVQDERGELREDREGRRRRYDAQDDRRA